MNSFDEEIARFREVAIDDPDLAQKALEFAWDVHAPQTRLSGEPYVIHPIRVALCVARECGAPNAVAVAAALLHDTVEDSDTTIDDLLDFPEAVVDAVHHLTKYKGGFETVTWRDEPFRFDPRRLVTRSERERFYLSWLEKGPDLALLIKCADRVDNLRDMATSGWAPKKRLSYADEGRAILTLAAGRLGPNHPACKRLEDQIRSAEREATNLLGNKGA